MSHLHSLTHRLTGRFSGLRAFQDDTQMRFCFPVASDEILYEHSTTPAERPIGEIMEIVENTFSGKFHMPVEPQASLEPASSPTHTRGPLATIEIWSLEPGSYDLVLRLPHHIAQNETQLTPIIERFIHQAREVARTVDNLDLLRFQAGPSMTLLDAHNRLSLLERQSGTRLDTDSLLNILNQKSRNLLN